MKVTFIRHGSLLPPFNDYSQLGLEELSQLARQEIDPTIDSEKILGKLKEASFFEKKYESVLVSLSQRTQDSANELGKYIDLPNFSIRNELKEIMFDPSKLTNKNTYQKEGLPIIRKELFKALVKGTSIEQGGEVIDRVFRLERLLNKSKSNSVLIITHGFFLRYLDIYFRQKSLDFSEDSLKQAINYSYLSGFTVKMD